MKLQLNAEISRQHFGVFCLPHIQRRRRRKGRWERRHRRTQWRKKKFKQWPSSVMNGINDYYLNLLYGKLRERAVCGEFCVLIGYPGGQDRAILPARDCLFRSRKLNSPKFKLVHENFLSPKLFSAKVKRIFVISLSLWNQKKGQREWKQRKQKCWWDLKVHFATKTGKHKSLFWIWNFNLKYN